VPVALTADVDHDGEDDTVTAIFDRLLGNAIS
jgi:hypothetical protein